MKASIQIKLLTLCVLLVIIMTAGVSTTYYMLTKQDKQRETRQRIRIAFDIILDDFTNRVQTYSTRLDDFLHGSPDLQLTIYSYLKNPQWVREKNFINRYLKKGADELKQIGHALSANRLLLYAKDKRLLAAYQWQDNQEMLGGYVISQTEKDTWLPLDDSSEARELLFGDTVIPDAPLPSEISGYYEGEIPDTMLSIPFKEGQQVGFKVIAPLYRRDEKIGGVVGVVFFSQEIVERYASLSGMEVNFFSGNQLSIGTLPAQTEMAPDTMEHLTSCNDILNTETEIRLVPASFGDQEFYQGQCAIKDPSQNILGALTVSFSQNIEKEAVRKTYRAVLSVSLVAILLAFVLSFFFSRSTIHSIQNIVHVLSAASEGDLRQTAVVTSRDEIRLLATKLNQMIHQLRIISSHVQNSSSAVSETAEAILQEINIVTQHMEQHSSSVEQTTTSVNNINQSITTVNHDTSELLSATEEISASLYESRVSREEIASSMEHLTLHLEQILAVVEQVNSSATEVSEHSEHLERVARQTESEIRRIDHSLQDVAQNADAAQLLAQETTNAAVEGKNAVDAAIQGISDLKEVVATTAGMIQEVNSWGGQVNSILDIVDDIAEQTSLLALNASIISAQAGSHGRGFAVVADEIKELATRTKTSTQEIGTLIRTLRKKAHDSVQNIAKGIEKADHGMQLATAVQDSLVGILERATRSSERAAGTAQVVQNTAASSRTISTSMPQVTEMVSQINTAIQHQEQDMSQVVEAVENIQAMSEQIKHANVEQNHATTQIEGSLSLVTESIVHITDQTDTLTRNSDQIVKAMRTVETITEDILKEMTEISGKRVNTLVTQSETLQKSVNIFKVS